MAFTLKMVVTMFMPWLAKLLRLNIKDTEASNFFMSIVKKSMEERRKSGGGGEGVRRNDFIDQVFDVLEKANKADSSSESKLHVWSLFMY